MNGRDHLPSRQSRLRQQITRRRFLNECALGLGAIALGSQRPGLFAADAEGALPPPGWRPPHFTPKARRVIFLFQAGGPSQLELFDHKPALQKWNGKLPPKGLLNCGRAALIDPANPLLAPTFKFRKAGQCGAELSELLPGLASIADEIAIVRSMKTAVFNHAPAQVFMNTGSPQLGRPSLGSWVTYGLGSQLQELPGYVVFHTGPKGTSGGVSNWGRGFLPRGCQGLAFRGAGEPAPLLPDPPNAGKLPIPPEVLDISTEHRAILERYGAEPGRSSFASACLVARRVAEKGVRFVQIFHESWDHHADLAAGLQEQCGATDKASAALVMDLKQRGLLEDTLVVWGGEFGRSPTVQGGSDGRDHHPDAFAIWLAGGGVRPGLTLGRTDELGFNVVEDPVEVPDLQATILHLLGFDHTKLSYLFEGRDFRPSDGHGRVVQKLLA